MLQLRLQMFIEYNSINHSIGILKRKINRIPFRLCCMNDTMVGRDMMIKFDESLFMDWVNGTMWWASTTKES